MHPKCGFKSATLNEFYPFGTTFPIALSQGPWNQYLLGGCRRPVDKYADMKKWVKVVNKKKLGIQPEVEAMVIQKGGIAESGLWDEALKNEWGKVISDVGCSFHGTDASGHLSIET